MLFRSKTPAQKKIEAKEAEEAKKAEKEPAEKKGDGNMMSFDDDDEEFDDLF